MGDSASLWADLLAIAEPDQPRPGPYPRIGQRARRVSLAPRMRRRWPLAVVLATTIVCGTVSLAQQATKTEAAAHADSSTTAKARHAAAAEHRTERPSPEPDAAFVAEIIQRGVPELN